MGGRATPLTLRCNTNSRSGAKPGAVMRSPGLGGLWGAAEFRRLQSSRQPAPQLPATCVACPTRLAAHP